MNIEPQDTQEQGTGRPDAAQPDAGQPSYSIAVVSEPATAWAAPEREFIRKGLDAFNRPVLGDDDHRPLLVIVRNAAGRVVGGLVGDLYYNWLYISDLWLDETARGQGVGAEVMRSAEATAARQGRTHVHVDTFDFQALAFYRKLGYEVFGELGPYGDGHIRYFLKKELRHPAIPGESDRQQP